MASRTSDGTLTAIPNTSFKLNLNMHLVVASRIKNNVWRIRNMNTLKNIKYMKNMNDMTDLCHTSCTVKYCG